VLKRPAQRLVERLRALSHRCRGWVSETYLIAQRRIGRIRAALHRWRTSERDKRRSACARAAAALRQGSYDSLRSTPASWRWPSRQRDVYRRLISLADILRSLQSAKCSGDDAIDRLRDEIEQTWYAAWRDGMADVATEVAGVAAQWGLGEMAAPIVSVIGRSD